LTPNDEVRPRARLARFDLSPDWRGSTSKRVIEFKDKEPVFYDEVSRGVVLWEAKE
jgi:hypothetical protein